MENEVLLTQIKIEMNNKNEADNFVSFVERNGIPVERELEMNREWIYAWQLDEDGEVVRDLYPGDMDDMTEDEEEIVGETNFVINVDYLLSIFDELFDSDSGYDKDDLEDFLLSYVPEEDGEAIYQKAIADGKIVEDIGIVLY